MSTEAIADSCAPHTENPTAKQAIRAPRWPQEPLLLAELEAAQLLRLIDDTDEPDAARRRINRLVDQGKLRPCMVGNRRRYALEELRRFVRDETERYGEAR